MTVCITNSRLIEIYEQTQSIRETGKKLGISHETVRYKLKKLGKINKPIRYTCNDNYFQLNTPEVFYWAGFIAADGCVKLKSDKYKQLSIGLSQKDHCHLEKFKEVINFDGPIHKISSQGYDRSELSISSDKLFNDLARFNIVPRKSLTYEFPEWLTGHSLVNHFMRGYFDGDGSFYASISKGRNVEQLYFSLRGTKKFLTTYKQILERNCKLKKSDKKPRLNSGIYMLEYGGTRAVGQIRDFLYTNATFNTRLKRKHNIAYDEKFVDIPEHYGHKRFVPVIGTNMTTGEETYFNSMKEAVEYGFSKTGISACCRGIYKYHKNYTWKYA